jgi:DNA-binding MarR family transcriptional regulator
MPPPPSVLRLTRILEEILSTMSQRQRTTLSRAGLSPSQARILSAIASRRKTRMSELTLDLGMSKSTVSSSLESLERMEILRRSRHEDDRRVYPIRLTEKGRALARRLQQDQEGALIRAATDLTPYQRKTLASALDALLEAMDRAREGRGT